MSVPTSPPSASALRVWVRRSLQGAEAATGGWPESIRAEVPSVYAVRYEAGEGRALLRIARPGVLIDPPPRGSGEEDGLTIAQLRESRLLHAEDAGRSRRAWSFGRLDPVALSGLPGGEWVELRAELVHGQGWYLLAERRRGGEGGASEEPTSPKRMLDNFREEIEAGSTPAPDPPRAAERQRTARRWSQDEPTEIPAGLFDDDAPTQRAPRPDLTVPAAPSGRTTNLASWAPASALSPVTLVPAAAPPQAPLTLTLLPPAAPPPVLPAALPATARPPAALPPAARPPVVSADAPPTVPAVSSALPTTLASAAGLLSATPASAPSSPEGVARTVDAQPVAEAWPGRALHERNTTLVRHLRRRIVADEQRIRELEARLKLRSPGGGR